MSPSASADPRLRLFVAAGLPADVASLIGEWQQHEFAAHPEVRLNRSLHITLAFLGDQPAHAVPKVTDELAALRFRPMRLTVGQAFFLPERGRKRVIALALRDEDGELRRVQAEVAARLARRGLYAPEKRPWMPHLTVARFRRPGRPFSLQNVNIPEVSIVRVVLYSSLLERTGAVHTPLSEFLAS